uniref:non-specific serine/threonine protein kinase n=1 Tax=Brassica oleracea var. oleracea TaxID=109376 RepID=A0A0D3A5H3_BRAOL
MLWMILQLQAHFNLSLKQLKLPQGTFPSATQVALKRLTKTSGQGEEEFMNELIYARIFSSLPDPKKNSQLDWSKRYNIIEGITCKILYLHQDSRLTIIHCDLKACNILLDEDLNPKIPDFGVTRKIGVDQTEATTGRVVGTFGYMPPEYVTSGQFSTKSDVYSFGILVL